MAERNYIRLTLYVTPAQDAFLQRKIVELRKASPKEMEDDISQSSILRGLIDFWQALENMERQREEKHKI